MEQKLLIWIMICVGICLVMTMLALVDIITKDFGSSKAKLFWHFVVLLPMIGWFLYLLLGFRRGTRKQS